ncbi:MAG: AsnC family transcriptional regulator [Desulfomonilaceae bacterium]|nr:AsnC family transcriptional regulator [Desulfomonilaceae bacterium]
MSSAQLDSIDKKILLALQGDFDESPEPYVLIAEQVGLSESEVLGRIRSMLENGVIRRLGAMIRHMEAGIEFNGMVVWRVPPERIDEVGPLLAAFPEVTHCYRRPRFGKLGGTLFTMVHSSSEEGCLEIVRRMSEKADVREYEILFSERELKKVSMTYFNDVE